MNFEGVALKKGVGYIDFFFNDVKVSHETFMLSSKKSQKIIETFNRFVKSDKFCEDTKYTVRMPLFKLNFVKEKTSFRLKGGPALVA